MNFNPLIFKRDKSGNIKYPFPPTADHYHVNYTHDNVDNQEQQDDKYQEPIKQTHCANCGAPLNPTKARCEYCNSYYAQEKNYVLESL